MNRKAGLPARRNLYEHFWLKETETIAFVYTLGGKILMRRTYSPTPQSHACNLGLLGASGVAAPLSW